MSSVTSKVTCDMTGPMSSRSIDHIKILHLRHHRPSTTTYQMSKNRSAKFHIEISFLFDFLHLQAINVCACFQHGTSTSVLCLFWTSHIWNRGRHCTLTSKRSDFSHKNTKIQIIISDYNPIFQIIIHFSDYNPNFQIIICDNRALIHWYLCSAYFFRYVHM